MNNPDNNLILVTYLIYIIFWFTLVVGGTGYATFVLDHSAWWWILALLLCETAYTPTSWKRLWLDSDQKEWQDFRKQWQGRAENCKTYDKQNTNSYRPTWCKVLGVSFNASETEIKDAYKQLAKKYHPDVNKGGSEQMKTVNEAYAAAMKHVKRYDSLRNQA